MICPRMEPIPVILDGKLYVIGGTTDGVNRECWAEVFDPCLDKWELLPPLPIEANADPFSFMSAVVDASKTILIAFPPSTVIYMYDVTKKTWEESNHDLMKYVGYFHSSQPLVVGQTLYWCREDGDLYAYDLKLKMWFIGPVQGFEQEGVMVRPADFDLHPTLFHLGGEKFCFLWSEDQSLAKDELCRSHCIKLRISKRVDSEGQGSLIAVINSCQSYLIDHRVSFTDGLLLNGRVGAEHYLEEGGASRAGQVFLGRNFLVPSMGGLTPLATQSDGVMQSSIDVTQQSVPAFWPPTGLHLSHYPPKYIPYDHCFSPFYAPPPTMHQFLSNGAFCQQPQTGCIYPAQPAPAATGVKYSLSQYELGSNTGNSAHIGMPSGCGPYYYPLAGYNPS